MMAAEQRIKKVRSVRKLQCILIIPLPLQELTDSTANQPTLVIFEDLASLPVAGSCLYSLLNRTSTHIIVTLHSDLPLDNLRKQIDSKIMRGINLVRLKPLSELQVTQRLVHSIVSRCEFTPYNKEQRMIAEIAEKTMGSPDLVEVTSALLAKYMEEEVGKDEGFLEKFYEAVCCENPVEAVGEDPPVANDFAVNLLDNFDLSHGDFFLLSTLSVFGAVPIPRSLVEMVQLLAITASPELPSKLTPLACLTSNNLLKVCPSTVVQSPVQHISDHPQSHLRTPAPSSSDSSTTLTESDFYYVPQIIADAVLGSMDEKDTIISVAAAHRSLNKFYTDHVKNGSSDTNLAPFMAGLAKILAKSLEKQEKMQECYKEAYRTHLLFAIAETADS
jgi:hypothetical protein